MTCAEFQRVLPYIIESGGNPAEEEHLRSCAQCSDLVNDLKYIAEQAKLLLPMRDPSQRVWQGIEQGLQREGLVRRSAAGAVRLRSTPLKPGLSWTALAGIAALIVLAFALVLPQRSAPPQQASVVPAVFDPADQQVIQAAADRDPSLRTTYENSLRDVNAYIQAAQQSVQQDPEDQQAREHLQQAYDQKAMLYDMAMGE